MRWVFSIALLLGLAPALAGASQVQQGQGAANAATLYAKHCAECHGADRLGRIGPALLPQNLHRLRQAKAVKVIAQGRIATQMPGFADVLNKDEIAALTKLIYTPPTTRPVWGVAEIKASLADWRADRKWPEYLDYCDFFYFAVAAEFPRAELPAEHGLMIADRFGADVARPAPRRRLNANRRRALTLRFARAAAERLQRQHDESSNRVVP